MPGPRLRYAQVDLSLFGDAKVRRLFRSTDEKDAYAAMGVWLDILLSSWASEERVSATDVLGPNAYDDLRRSLVSAGLLDDDERIPSGTWAKWWGSIEQERESARDRKRRQRESEREMSQMSRVTDRDKPGQAVTDGLSRSVFSSVLSSSLPFSEIGESEREEGPGDRSPGLDLTYYDLTARVMSPRQLAWARSLEEQYGLTTSVETMKRVYGDGHKVDSLLPDTSDALKLLANGKARRDEDEKAAREKQARHDRSERQQREMSEARDRAMSTDPRPLAELMPDIAQVFGKSKGGQA